MPLLPLSLRASVVHDLSRRFSGRIARPRDAAQIYLYRFKKYLCCIVISNTPMTSPRVKWTPLLHRIGKVDVSKSSYGFTQEPTEKGFCIHLWRVLGSRFKALLTNTTNRGDKCWRQVHGERLACEA
jgi:hypothetical protein